MRAPSPTSPPLAGAAGRRAWYGLEQRHHALFVLRAVVALVVAVPALTAPLDLDGADRMIAVLVCAGAMAAHGALRLLAGRAPRTLRATVDAGLVVDAAMIFGLAVVSGYLDSDALWIIPVLCVAVALGLSALTGAKALVLFAVATGAVAVAGPPDADLRSALGPLVVAAAGVIVTATMSSVNERELRGRGERLDALHDASAAFVASREPDELAGIARSAAARLLPGWDVEVRLDTPVTGGRTWRAGDRVHLAMPILTPAHDGANDAGQAHGMLLAQRPAPRRERAATIRGRQLQALGTLCTGLATALAQVELMRRLERLSMVDPLTGLGNRRAFDRAIDIELARSRRGGLPLGLVVLDVDHFKRFNDTHGHPAGDRALAAVGACLAGIGRREDSACRIGGEEFALLLPGAGDAAAAEVAERVRRAVEAISLPEGTVTVSLGVASTMGDTAPSTLVAEADRRLYEAKRKGRNRVVSGAGALFPATG
jgi:diguanylate cyclase (GGDEF)-like protein